MLIHFEILSMLLKARKKVKEISVVLVYFRLRFDFKRGYR
jgi:hypothetical protein